MKHKIFKSLIFIWLILFPSLTVAKQKLIIVTSDISSLTIAEQNFVKNKIIKGFIQSNKFDVINIENTALTIEEQITEALHKNEFPNINNILNKHKIDILIKVTASVESKRTIAGYYLSAAHVGLQGVDKNQDIVFQQVFNDPQNGFHGIPEWLGSTEKESRILALSSAIYECFKKWGIDTVQPVLPINIRLSIKSNGKPFYEFIPKKIVSDHSEYEHILRLNNSIGRRPKITAVITDPNERIAFIGVTEIDIDLQRMQRTDFVKIIVLDNWKRRVVKRINIPNQLPGIRRPWSKDIVDFAFSYDCRFLVVATKHPSIMIYDILAADLITSYKLPEEPQGIYLDKLASNLKIVTKGNTYFYKIIKK